MVKVTLACAEEDVADLRLHFLLEGAVSAHAYLEVGAVGAHHIDESFGQFVAVFLIDPPFDGLYDFGMREREDVVPAAGIASVCREEAAVVQSLEGDAEVVAAGVHGIFEVLECPDAQAVALSLDDVQSAHSYVSVAGEVEISVGTEDGEHLVARGVDGVAYVFHASESVLSEGDAPNVEAALSAWHIAGEVEPSAVGRYGWVSIAGECVFADLQELWFAPRSIAACAGIDFGIAWIVGIVGAAREVHRLAVGREAADAFFVFAVELAFSRFGLIPLPLVIFS